jgi:uncharacterized protein
MSFLQRFPIVLFIATLTMASSCKKPHEVTPFDKESLLLNFSDNVIQPALISFQSSINQLNTDFQSFQTTPSNENLEMVRASWKEAYLSWQSIKCFDFGPIKTTGFKAATGTYPSDTTKIEANIAAGTYTLASASNVDAIGLHALDFFFYRANALSYFTGNAGYSNYASDLIAKLKSETDAVVSAWATYAPTFKASTGTETTSAFSELVNEFNKDYETAKSAKLGVPIGKQSLGIQLPEYIEARNSGFSFDILRQNIVVLKNYYNGNSMSGSNGVGFDDYLIHLERESLHTMINANFDEILAKIDSFSGTLEEEMASNPQGLDELYNLLQGQVISLKTEMTSAFGVLITYQDNDGD